MRVLKALCAVVTLIAAYPHWSYASASYQVTLKVIGENNAPIEGANTYIGFETDTFSGPKMFANKGVTNSDGTFQAVGMSNGHLTYGALKEGYYDSNYTYDFPGGRQALDHSFAILLRKVVNPVPMYARDTKRSIVEIPVIGQDVGFDLIAFDWVSPYGRGTQPDFIFNLKRPLVVSRTDYAATLTIAFANEHDGIQSYFESRGNGSTFKLPRIAPEAGYKQKLVLQESYGEGRPATYNFNFRAEDLNYLFRVRSEEKDGKLVKAMYGKIQSYISFSAIRSKTAKIYFKYYLNPDYTRNLEFNPKRNLFGTLSRVEQVIEP